MTLIDMVSWGPEETGRTDSASTEFDRTNPIFAWKYHDKKGNSSNLSTYTQLVVRESQEAVLFSKGQLLGKFGPGKYTLNTENLPLLRSLYGIPFGGKNPFLAEIWFVNKLIPLNIDWITSGMMHQDPDYQVMLPLSARGRYGLRVQDAERFLIKLVGTALEFRATGLTDQFKGALEAKTKTTILSYMQSQHIGIKHISGRLEQLSVALRDSMQAFWEDYGFRLEGFYVTSIQVDDADPNGKRILEAISQQSAQAIAGFSWQQAKAFEVADNAVSSMRNNSGGLLGALLVTNMMGSGVAGGGGALLQPNPAGVPSTSQTGQESETKPLPPREVFCSNCARKYLSNSKFCPHCRDPYTPCPRCGADNDQKARRCTSCGTPLATPETCSHCGGTLPPNSSTCPSCARPVGVLQSCMKCKRPLGVGDTFCGECGTKVI
jgi:membrane protease subunit (stomatin/prohibitin family)